MVMAVELYQAESERQFCHCVTYAHRKLVQFVVSRKQMTAESYRFFDEHAYNQLVQYECFHISAHSRTKAKYIGASGVFQTLTKLAGYISVGSDSKPVHVPQDQAGDVQMDSDEDVEEAEGEVPKLEVKSQQDEHDDAPHDEPQVEEQNDDETHEEEQDEPMEETEGVGSQQREETQEQAGDSEETERDLCRQELVVQEKDMAITSCLSSTTRIFLNCAISFPLVKEMMMIHKHLKTSTPLEWFGLGSSLQLNPIETPCAHFQLWLILSLMLKISMP